jgi:hypothetical protein
MKKAIIVVCLFLLLAVVVYLRWTDINVFLYTKILKTAPVVHYVNSPPRAQVQDPASHFELKVNKFSTDEYGHYTVIGEIKNTDVVPYKFVHVQATFLNKDGEAVGDEDTFACATDYILPGGSKPFKFMGENKPDYKTVRCAVTSCREVI